MTVTDPSSYSPIRSRRTATVLAWVLPHLLAYVSARGHDAAGIRRLPGLVGRPLDDPDIRVTDQAAAEAWRLAQHITGDAALGLHMAQWIPAGGLDVLEYAFRSSPTLGSGLEQIARYAHAVSDRAQTRLEPDGDALVMTWGGSAQAQRVEFALAILVRIAREASGAHICPQRVRFAHAGPMEQREYDAFFGSPVLFEQPANQLLWDSTDTPRALRSADSGLSSLVRRRLDKLLAQLPPADDSTLAATRRMLLGRLARGEPTAASIARELGLSERTLHRRLRSDGQSFRDVLDGVRGELATGLLREPGVGIAEIAFFLGYSEPAAFYRFFRRWSGQTPLQFRRASRTAQPH